MQGKLYLVLIALNVPLIVFLRRLYSAYLDWGALIAASPVGGEPLLIVLSIDGFRFDYLWRGRTPALLSLIQRGVVAPLRPQYPSYTFPNHYTLVTGLLPSKHGIVSNHFYDPRMGEYFAHDSDNHSINNPQWWLAQPVPTNSTAAIDANDRCGALDLERSRATGSQDGHLILARIRGGG